MHQSSELSLNQSAQEDGPSNPLTTDSSGVSEDVKPIVQHKRNASAGKQLTGSKDNEFDLASQGDGVHQKATVTSGHAFLRGTAGAPSGISSHGYGGHRGTDR